MSGEQTYRLEKLEIWQHFVPYWVLQGRKGYRIYNVIIMDLNLQNVTTSSLRHNATTTEIPEENESDSLLGSYLWLPYVVLTVVFIAMLVASFINFHCKYKDRYILRTTMARGSSGVNHNGDLTTIVSDNTKTRRLKMLYGNKVDVSSIIVNSMLDNVMNAERRSRYEKIYTSTYWRYC